MFQNHLKIALRVLMRNKFFSLINIFGLAVGMTVCLLIFQYVSFELSYDKFHEQAGQIYRVQYDRYIDGELQYQKAQAFIPTGEVMKDEYPEVLEYTTLFKISAEADIIMKHVADNGEAIQFSENEVYHVKGKFFDIFSLSIIDGQKYIQGLDPNTVVISQSAAHKYFGDSSPIGKTLSHNYAEGYKIVGVFEDLPGNTHIKFDFLFAWQQMTNEESGGDVNNWRWDGFYTYLLLAPNTDVQALESKFPSLVEKYKIGQINEHVKSVLALQPLTSIHLHSNLIGEAEKNGESTIVYSLLALAVFILAIALINYINLSTARSLDRAKEIGVRKVVGSGKKEIVKQFLTESLLTNFLALSLALLTIRILYVPFAEYTGINASLSLFSEPQFWVAVILILIFGGFAAGLHPAFILSGFDPVKSLKGKYHHVHQNTSWLNVRHTLVIFQFIISITLIAASMVVYMQLSFMKSQDLGISIDKALVVKTQATFGPPGSDSLFLRNLSVLKDKLITHSGIEGVTATYDIPGKEYLSLMSNFRHSKSPEEFVSLYFTRMDTEFIPAFNVKMIAGSNFLQGADNQPSMILNQEALRALGFEDPHEAIGHEVVWGNQNPNKAKIVGVVDFRSTSFKNHNYPVAFTSTFFPFKYLSIVFEDLKGDNAKQNIALIEKNWQAVFPDIPFEHFFLDDLFNRQYKAEQQFSQLLGIFTILAIIVACLGLYAISSLTVAQKTKEVGLRKILGASLNSLLMLLSKRLVALVLVAGLISLPIVHFATAQWMQNYPYRIVLTWWIFLIPIALLLIITVFTIGYQIVKTALINPSELLRYE